MGLYRNPSSRQANPPPLTDQTASVVSPSLPRFELSIRGRASERSNLAMGRPGDELWLSLWVVVSLCHSLGCANLTVPRGARVLPGARFVPLASPSFDTIPRPVRSVAMRGLCCPQE